MSKKFSAAALIAITASPGPATGSGTSASTRSSGWQYCEQRIAFMAAPRAFQGGLAVGPFLPDLDTGHNPVSACVVFVVSSPVPRMTQQSRLIPSRERWIASRRWQRGCYPPANKPSCAGRIQTMFETGLLKEKRILVTGGGSGLGAAMAHRFLALGAELVICGRKLDRLEAAARGMREETGGKVTTIACDIRDGTVVESMMDAVWREAPLDILVNNAAATFIAQSEHLSFRAADAILAPTLHGTMYCTLAAGRRWIDGKHAGVVLSILSTSTITGRAFTVPSAMAKSAVLAMTRSLAVEWGPKG